MPPRYRIILVIRICSSLQQVECLSSQLFRYEKRRFVPIPSPVRLCMLLSQYEKARKSPGFPLEAYRILLLVLLAWLIAMLATLTGVLRLLAWFLGMITLLSALTALFATLVLLAALVLVRTCHNGTPLVIY